MPRNDKTKGTQPMPNMTRRAALGLLPLGAVVALAGCQTSTASVTSSSGDMSATDLDFVTNAYNIIEFDRQECTIAQTASKNPAVRAIAAKLLQDANTFDSQLTPIAASAGIKAPTILRTDLRIRAARLRLGQGPDFDRAFIDDQIVSHQDTLNLQSMMMDAPGGNAKLADLSRRGYDLVKANLAELQKLQRSMML